MADTNITSSAVVGELVAWDDDRLEDDNWRDEWGDSWVGDDGFDGGEGDSEEEEEAPTKPLTQWVSFGGSESKWRPGEFGNIAQRVAPTFSQEATKGFAEGDDCFVMHINDGQATVFTLDWFPPVVDNPYQFGAISAAAALSNLYAAGVKPMTALNMMALPCKLGVDIVGEVMRGGSDKVIEAGAFVVGGHSIDDNEPKYGLAAFGLTQPEKIVRNDRACPGDMLFYTKPLGSGIMSAALRMGLETEDNLGAVIDSMMELNAPVVEVMEKVDVHAAITVSGLGIVGHLHTLLQTCGAAAVVEYDSLSLYDGALEYNAKGVRPNRSAQTARWVGQAVMANGLNYTQFENRMGLLCDPQTSGGLLVAVSADEADAFANAFEEAAGRRPSLLGTVTEGDPGSIILA